MRSDVKALPARFLERLRRIIPAQQWDAVANTFTQPKPTTFRVNSLKATVREIRTQLAEQGFQLGTVPWYPQALILRAGRLRDLQETEAYQTGAIYVQSLSSMLPALMLDLHPGQVVLDLTAAPGSKTTQMACMMRGEGRLVANDNHPIRSYRLRANVEQQAARNVELWRQEGAAIGRAQPDRFDRVLVDAPCSTEGRFQVHAPKSYGYWKPLKIREMARKQKRLLRSGILALRPGGLLVYATCTFAPEENEGVVSWVLQRFGEAIHLETVKLPIANVTPGLTSWEDRPYHPSLRHAQRILPTSEMEGFFIARITKRLGTGPTGASRRDTT